MYASFNAYLPCQKDPNRGFADATRAWDSGVRDRQARERAEAEAGNSAWATLFYKWNGAKSGGGVCGQRQK